MMGRTRDADAAYDASIAISKQLVEKCPDVPIFQINLGINYFNLGNRYDNAGRTSDAETAYKTSLALYKTVAERNVGVPSYSSDLAESYDSLAVFYCKAGRFQDALAAYQSAIYTYQALVGKYPKNPDYVRASAACKAIRKRIAGAIATQGKAGSPAEQK